MNWPKPGQYLGLVYNKSENDTVNVHLTLSTSNKNALVVSAPPGVVSAGGCIHVGGCLSGWLYAQRGVCPVGVYTGTKGK